MTSGGDNPFLRRPCTGSGLQFNIKKSEFLNRPIVRDLNLIRLFKRCMVQIGKNSNDFRGKAPIVLMHYSCPLPFSLFLLYTLPFSPIERAFVKKLAVKNYFFFLGKVKISDLTSYYSNFLPRLRVYLQASVFI